MQSSCNMYMSLVTCLLPIDILLMLHIGDFQRDLVSSNGVFEQAEGVLYVPRGDGRK